MSSQVSPPVRLEACMPSKASSTANEHTKIELACVDWNMPKLGLGANGATGFQDTVAFEHFRSLRWYVNTVGVSASQNRLRIHLLACSQTLLKRVSCVVCSANSCSTRCKEHSLENALVTPQLLKLGRSSGVALPVNARMSWQLQAGTLIVSVPCSG
eukprot:1964907-Amphidinium_carterae.1